MKTKNENKKESKYAEPSTQEAETDPVKIWKVMEEGILKKVEHAKDYWGFGCLKNSTNLVYDIGKEVYYVLGNEVCKGKIAAVNSFGMCKIQMNDNSYIYIAMRELYGNVHYALCKAKHNYALRDNAQEQKTAKLT